MIQERYLIYEIMLRCQVDIVVHVTFHHEGIKVILSFSLPHPSSDIICPDKPWSNYIGNNKPKRFELSLNRNFGLPDIISSTYS